MAPRIKDAVILLITKWFANIANTQSGYSWVETILGQCKRPNNPCGAPKEVKGHIRAEMLRQFENFEEDKAREKTIK